jgi:hypothetical protein
MASWSVFVVALLVAGAPGCANSMGHEDQTETFAKAGKCQSDSQCAADAIWIWACA